MLGHEVMEQRGGEERRFDLVWSLPSQQGEGKAKTCRGFGGIDRNPLSFPWNTVGEDLLVYTPTSPKCLEQFSGNIADIQQMFVA